MRISAVLAAVCLVPAFAQTALTWQQVKEKFAGTNPTLQAGQINIQESKDQEITAFLRPNPNLSFTPINSISSPRIPYRPLQYLFPCAAFDYLHERQNKRELRLESAQPGDRHRRIAADRPGKNPVLHSAPGLCPDVPGQAVLALATDNLGLLRQRARPSAATVTRPATSRAWIWTGWSCSACNIESDFQTAQVNLRTAKITMLALLNDRTPIDQFDVTGPFDFAERLMPLEEFHEIALASRPDLKAAVQAVDKAQTDHKLAVANGSTDPTFGMDFGAILRSRLLRLQRQHPAAHLRQNQGEKARTEIDIEHAERLRDAAQAQVFSDVDSAYVTLVSSVNLLRPYQGAEAIC